MAPPEIVAGAGAGQEALARVVHDLRSPLTVIRGLLFALQREHPEEGRRRHLDLIDREVDRLAAGLERLMCLRTPSEPDACLTAAATDAAERHRTAAAAHGVVLTARTPPRPVPVRADPSSIDRILDNLIGNALRHSPGGGEVRVSVRVRAGAAVLTVRDQGAGVPPADRARIFRPGDRGTAPQGPGHGLGLAICRDLADRHGGRLELVPVGPGATFRLVLPLVDAAADGPGRAA